MDINMREMEEEVITEILRYAIYIITKVVKPTRLVYISIDGPVPVAKMERQRSRRFKKIQDCAFAQKTRRKYNMDDDKSFDSNRVTPGTMFMSKLNSRIKNYITIGAFATHTKKSIRVVFSDSNVAGEGEYKIFEYIRNCKTYPKIHIYGMDADLIMLSMAVNRPNIRLMREASTVDSTTDAEFSYIDVDMCKKVLYDDYISEDMKKSLSLDAFIRDFILYSKMGGNDFVHPLPHCKMRTGGLEKLTRVYVIVYSLLNTSLVSPDGKINHNFMKHFLSRLSDSEDLGMKRSSGYRNTPNEQLTYEREVEMYEHSEYANPKNPFHLFYKDTLKEVDYKKNYDEWVNEYNSHFFKDTDLSVVVKEYFKSLTWSYKYYYGEIPSWTYYYPYRTSPPIKTIVEHFDEKYFDVQFEMDTVLSPFEQLMYVMPAQNCRLLPYGLQDMMTDPESPIAGYYPSRFKLDAIAGGKNIYSEALLPHINIPYIRCAVSNIPLNDHEIMRNTVVEQPFHKTCH
tara:strand:- start:14452 stop:15984 length:1533 start_codon:yes stop_codon:yes gene_type:complete